jgi:hypothetical protein
MDRLLTRAARIAPSMALVVMMGVSTLNTDILSASLGKAVALAYGRHWVGGNIVLLDGPEDGSKTAFIGLGEGVWDAIEELWVDGLEIDLATAMIFHFHKGLVGELSTGGTLDPEGVGSPYGFSTDGDQKADLWTPAGIQGLTFSKTAYLALQVPFDIYAPGPELTVVGLYRCRKVRTFDAGGTETGFLWRDNPAWCIADLLTKVRGLSDSRIGWASFVAAANYCDALINPDGAGAVKRFVSNVAFTEEVDFDTAMNALLATCRGRLLDEGGSIKLRIDQTRASVFDFNMGNIIDGSFSAEYKDTRAAANRLELMFRDTANKYQVITKMWDHLVQQSRIGRVIPARIQFGNMQQQQAERLGNYLLTRAIDNNLFVRLKGDPSSFKVLPGDVVRVWHDAAPWAQLAAGENLYQAFEVEEVTENPDESRDYALRIYQAGTYTDTSGPSQNLIDTTIPRRPAAPPAPENMLLSANLGGDLRLAFDIPVGADYRIGDLHMLVDLEKERVETTLVAAVNEGDPTITVADSTGYKVGQFVAFKLAVMEITGPGAINEEPSSDTWNVTWHSDDGGAGAALAGDPVYGLTKVREHWAFLPGYTLANPTINLANGPYFIKYFRPGRMRILYAGIQFAGIGGLSTVVEQDYHTYPGEPAVPGTLPGIRVADGLYGMLTVKGPLSVTESATDPGTAEGSGIIGLVFAGVGRMPLGADIHIQARLNGVDLGPEAIIPSGVEWEADHAYTLDDLIVDSAGHSQKVTTAGTSGSTIPTFDDEGGTTAEGPDTLVWTDQGEAGGAETGVYFSGARTGNVAGGAFTLAITQVGSTYPGSDLWWKVIF